MSSLLRLICVLLIELVKVRNKIIVRLRKKIIIKYTLKCPFKECFLKVELSSKFAAS